MAKKNSEANPDTEAAPVQQEASSASAVGLETTPVVVGPKFNRDVRPVATEQLNTTPIPVRQSYESIQESARGPGVEQWREADRARAELTSLYNRLREDSRYTEEHKARSAWQEFEKTRTKVEQLAPEARRKMLKSAEGLERGSIPMPEGEGLLTKDTTKLLLTQGERSRIEGLINRAEKAADKGPFKANPIDVLRTAYEQGLDEGGPGGGATVRAVIGLARDYGLDVDQIVDACRRPYHREALENAQASRVRAELVGRSVPQPPFPHPDRIRQTSERTGTYGSDAKAFIPQQKGMLFGPKNRRASWR